METFVLFWLSAFLSAAFFPLLVLALRLAQLHFFSVTG